MNVINSNKNKRSATLIVVVVVFVLWLFLSSTSSSLPSTIHLSQNIEQTLEPTPSSSSYHHRETIHINNSHNIFQHQLSANTPPLCILPVGDSLTQGVEMYTGYRAFLKKEILRTFEKNKNVHFVGSKVGTCVLGKPTNIFDPLRSSSSSTSKIKRDTVFESKVLKRIRENEHDEQKFFFEELHEGHCSWGARLLRERLDQVIVTKTVDEKRLRQAKSNLKNNQPLIRGPQSSLLASKFQDHPCRVLKKSAVQEHLHNSDDEDDDGSLLFRYDIALLMIGHNNVFQIASFCKMKEGRRLSKEALEFLLTIRKKGRKRTSHHRHSGGNLSSEAGDDDDDTRQEQFFKFLSQKEKCAYSVLKSDFVPHIEAMISKLLGGDDFKNNDNNIEGEDDVAPSASSSFPKLIIGLNPPTGFPNINILLHYVLKETVRKYSMKQLLSVRDRISLASFPHFGFGKEKHTFDSTHPNEEGAKILAQGWSEAIKKVL